MKNPKPHQSRSIEQVEQEHEELRELIGAIHKSLATPSSPIVLIKKQLSTLCEKLESHFRTEEAEGFFTEIIEHAPRFSGQAEKLTEEHHSMLEAAKVITGKAHSCADRLALSKDVQPAFHELSKHLMHHESEENELMQKAYWEDIGPAD